MKRCTHRRFLLLRLDTPSSPHFPLICILYIMELPPTRRRRLFSAVLLILLPRDLPYSCLIGQGSPIPIPALLTVKLNPGPTRMLYSILAISAQSSSLRLFGASSFPSL